MEEVNVSFKEVITLFKLEINNAVKCAAVLTNESEDEEV